MNKLLRALVVSLCLVPLSLFAQTADQEIVSVVDSPDPVTPGATLSYVVTARNNGPNPAVNGGVNINLPLSVTHTTDVVPAGWNCFWLGSNGSCITPSFAAGATEVVTINVTVDASLANFPDQSIGANFFTSGTTTDPNSANNSKSASTLVDAPQVDVSVAVTDSPDPVFPNGNITYTIDVANAGPDPATNVNFNVYHANGLKFVSGTQPAGWSCTFPAVGGTPIYTCSRASFPTGTSQFSLVLNVDPNVVGINDGTFYVAFSASGTGDDTNDPNNSETESTAYTTPDADVSVTVSDSPDPVFPDGNITYTVTVANSGPDTAPNISLNSFGNNNLRFVSASVPAGWNCTLPSAGAQTPGWNCTLAAGLTSGANSVLTFVLQADDALIGINDTTVQFGFSANSSVTDPVNGNNSETETTAYVTPDADVAVTVSDSPDPVTPDGNITYTVTVSNNGPDTAPNITLSSFGNNNLRFVSATVPGGWNCTLPSAGAQTAGYSCTLAAGLTSGANSVLTFVMQADDALIGNSDTNVQFGFGANSTVSDPVNGNNSETEVTAYDVPNADLGVTATDSPDPVAAGSNITYTGTITSAGGDTASTVTFTANLASGLLFQSITGPAGFSCTTPSVGTNGAISCTIASLANGASVPFTLVAQVNPSLNSGPDGLIQQQFMISATTNDPVLTNNSITVNTNYTTPDANLAVTNTDTPDPATQGGTITYTQTVTNNGPDAATNASFTTSTGAGTTFQSFNAPAGWSCTTPAVGATGSITCTNASFPNAGLAVFTLVVNVTGTGSIGNTASITSATYDPTPGNNTATASTNVPTPTSADLSVTKSTTATTAPIGSTFSYTIVVTNHGPDAATSVVMTDTLPSSLLFRSITQPSPFTCTTPAVGATGTITCNAATLANGASRTFTLVVEVASGATGSILNSASVSSAAGDSNSGNSTGSAGAVAAAPASADVSIVKSTTSSQAVTGTTLTYTILVSNAGPSPATNVIVTDDLPAGLSFVDATPTQGSCNASDPLSCNLGTIASGSSATVTIHAMVTATSGTVANTANVSSTEGGGDTSTTPPIPVVITATAAGIPTLSEWALIALALALAVVALKSRL